MKKGVEILGENVFGRGIFDRNFERKTAEEHLSENLSEINRLIRVLGRHLEKFEEAYNKKDPVKFNLLKKEILQIQERIHSLIR